MIMLNKKNFIVIVIVIINKPQSFLEIIMYLSKLILQFGQLHVPFSRTLSNE